jgi:hypothetical protein
MQGPSNSTQIQQLGGQAKEQMQAGMGQMRERMGQYPDIMQKLQGMQGGDAMGVMPWEQLRPMGQNGFQGHGARAAHGGMGQMNAQSFAAAGGVPGQYAPSATPITTGGSVASTLASPAATGEQAGGITPPSSVVGAQPGPSGPPPAAPTGNSPQAGAPSGQGGASARAIMAALRNR